MIGLDYVSDRGKTLLGDVDAHRPGNLSAGEFIELVTDAGELCGCKIVWVPNVGEPGRPSQRRSGLTAHPQWRMGLLAGHWLQPDVAEREELTVEGDFATLPAGKHHLDRLVGDAATLREQALHTQRAVFDSAPAGAHAQVDTTLRQDVDGGDHF